MALSRLAALYWLAPLLAIPDLARRTPDLANAPRRSGRFVSIIIPARNEATGIETVLHSVLASEYDPFEVIVVDDRSTDETAAITARIAAADSRLTLVPGAELPAGWFGKPWACLQGFRVARGDLLLFTDADTRHAPDLLPHAVGALVDSGADLLTAVSQQRCETLWERLVMPQIWLLLGLRYRPEDVNRATRAHDVIANGQFVLVTREGYRAAGTHEAVRHEVAEDVALAQEFLRAGRKLRLVHAESLLETRMYQGLRHLIEGWTKNLYLGARRACADEPIRRALVPAVMAGVMIYWLLPVAMVLWPETRAAGLLALGLSAAFWMLVSVGMRIPPAYGLGYPLGAAMALYIILRSAWRGARAVEWKGRTYRVNEASRTVVPDTAGPASVAGRPHE
jgi:chlorobactene glucosyltransferase